MKTGVKIVASIYGIIGTLLAILWGLMAAGVWLFASVIEQISISDVNSFIDLIQQYTPIVSDIQQESLNWFFTAIFGNNGALITLGVIGATALIYLLAAWLLKMDSVYGYYLAMALQGLSAISALLVILPGYSLINIAFLLLDLILIYYLYQNIPT